MNKTEAIVKSEERLCRSNKCEITKWKTHSWSASQIITKKLVHWHSIRIEDSS